MSLPKGVYVIMPIGSDPLFADRQRALALAIERSGHVPIFPAYHPAQQEFSLSETLASLADVASIIADLSLERPSCYYELGVVETTGKPVHLVAQCGTPIHQCAGRAAVNYYLTLDELTGIVEKALQE